MKIERYALLAGIILGAFAIGFFLRPIIYPPKPIVIEREGTITSREQPKQDKVDVNTVATNCQGLAVRLNACITDFDSFLKTPPIIDEITESKIRFHIRGNQYEFAYKSVETPRWHIAPVVGAVGYFNPLRISIGAGVSVDYANIGGMVIASDSFAFLGGYFRF